MVRAWAQSPQCSELRTGDHWGMVRMFNLQPSGFMR
jgi:hypothetical protein